MAAAQLQRYGRVAIGLHWVIALLILLNLPIGFFAEMMEARRGINLVPLHKSIGLTVLALSLASLVWRAAHRPPPLPASLSRWRARSARIVHVLLYILIIAVPLAGWLRTSPNAYPLSWFGLVSVPKFPIERGSSEAAMAAVSHTILAWAMLLLVLVHVAAALHHHFRLRDPILARMLPARSA